MGINSVGKSSVIQSILLTLQAEGIDEIDLNGNLISLGDYNDVLNVNADDDSIRLTIELNNKKCTWGFKEGYINNGSQKSILPILSGDSAEFKTLKDNFQYIAAERWGPRDNVPVLQDHRTGWLGKNGEHVIEYLYSLTNESSINQSISNLLEADPRIHPDATSQAILSSIEAWLGEISPGVNLNINVYREANIGWGLYSYGGDSYKYRAGNIGFGISYSLSIISAIMGAKPGDLLLIENPEAHIHPRGQSKLGQLLSFAASAGIQLIVETHSEHVINGARLAIRNKKLCHDKMSIFFFAKEKNNTSPAVTEIKSDKRATLSSWPEGFFDQSAIDMEMIIRG